jgi:predicted TIM-barrel fold metal-dependent hydrolase
VFDTTRAAVNLVYRRDRTYPIRPAGACRRADADAWRLSVAEIDMAARSRRAGVAGCAVLDDNALAPTAETFECLKGVAPENQIVFGSDWPFANARVIAEAVRTYEGVTMPKEQRDAIDRANALSLFPQFA